MGQIWWVSSQQLTHLGEILPSAPGALTGRETDIAVKVGATWGTPVTFGIGDGQLFKTWAVTPIRVDNQDDSLQPYVQNQDRGRTSVTGEPTAYLRYRGPEVLIAACMGIADITAELNVGEGDHRHDLHMATTIDGTFVTIAALLKNTTAHRVASAKIHGITISGTVGRPIEIAYALQGDDVTTELDTILDSATVPDSGNRVLADNNFACRINDQSAGALSSPTDNVDISEFTWKFARDMGLDWLRGSLSVQEPSEGAHPDPVLSVTLPRYNDDEFYDAWTAKTPKKGLLQFTGAQIAGGANRDFSIYFPHLEVIEGEPELSGPGNIPQVVNFRCLGVTAAPIGFEATDFTPNLARDITGPAAILITNDRTVGALI